MLAKPIMQQVQRDFGVNTFRMSEEEVPETMRNLALHAD